MSAVLLGWTKGVHGDFLGRFTDHLHHTRATWTFFVVGLRAYRMPFEVTGAEVSYPQDGITWGQFPIAYPPGMFVVFTPVAVIGRYLPLSKLEFGKLVIAYLTIIMHGALAVVSSLMRRVESKAWVAVLVMIWIFSIRAALLGFYDGAWLLFGALGVHEMGRKEQGHAVLYFVVAALISYRAVSFAPMAVVAFVALLRSGAPCRNKLVVSLLSVVAGVTILLTFRMLLVYGPKEIAGAGSALLPLSFRGYVVLVVGLVSAVLLARGTSLLVGVSVAFSSVLSVLHAGHVWHGFLCVPSILAVTLAERKPLWAQIVAAAWLAFFWQFAFSYSPFEWLEELLRFIELDGRYVPSGY